MSLHQNPELKKAVLNLSQKEKDKLLVRLIGKDKLLLKQLHFQLLEDEYDLENRVKELKAYLAKVIDISKKTISNTPTYANFKELNYVLRHASGVINEHEKVTKDKIGEFESRLLLIKTSISLFPKLFQPDSSLAAEKLKIYMTGRIKNLVMKFEKLHEDIQFDYQEIMDYILDFADHNKLRS
ncbi:hypothetical protein [Sphingobacterium hungaricum]|uniref:Uncharacterized protein n=1 Tax=Sphingobacterium hungaricum TaxID=2082723 RepID=A0A928YQL0_9SPHI|nr:hypothetical protein [Sphingobacterium hungaricum]MBE8714074.1 hypothetical protein [Sphingobacterium hungaricum]